MRYLLTILALTLLFLGAVFAFNWWVDPWGYFGRYPFGVYGDGTFRHIKAQTVARLKPEAVLFGASTAVQTNPAEISGCAFYNASFNGVRPTEELYFIKEFLPASTKVVVIGLDFFVFNKATEAAFLDPDFGHYSLNKTVSYALSMKGTQDSIKAIKWSRRADHPSSINPNGQREVNTLLAGNAETPAYDHREALAEYREVLFRDWQYNGARMDTLRQIRDELAARGTRLAVYVSPMSESLLGLIDEMGITPDLARFRADLKSVLPDALDFTGSEFTAKEYFYKRDPLHFLPSTGKALLERTLTAAGLCGYSAAR